MKNCKILIFLGVSTCAYMRSNGLCTTDVKCFLCFDTWEWLKGHSKSKSLKKSTHFWPPSLFHTLSSFVLYLPTYLLTAASFLFTCRKSGTTITGDLSSRWLAGCKHGRFHISSPGLFICGIWLWKSPWRTVALQKLRPRHFGPASTDFEVICRLQSTFWSHEVAIPP